MRRKLPTLAILGVAMAFLSAGPAQAAPHISRRLGDPATRFADPLRTPEDLRQRLTSEQLKADVASILDQWNWPGDVEDLRRAAATAPIEEVRLPNGSRFPFMSSRKNGKPVILLDVIWAGDAPIEAYAFNFASRGVNYRCVTPKACSNFWVEVRPQPPPPVIVPPRLELIRTAPAEAGLCGPIAMSVIMRNTGGSPLTEVRVTDTLPAGLRTTDQQTQQTFDVGTLLPGQVREFKFNVLASGAGRYEGWATAASAEGLTGRAGAATVVRAPVLTLECDAPDQVYAGRPVTVCLTVRNIGDAIEEAASVGLRVPAGAELQSATAQGRQSDDLVLWDLRNIAPGNSVQLCAVFTRTRPGSFSFAAAARGACAPQVRSLCTTRLPGISAILLEVIDLDDPIEVGGIETYVIRVLNQGSSVGTNIKLVCTLEEAQQFISGSGPTAVRADGPIITIEPLATLAPQAEAVWRLSIRAVEAGDVRFTVELTSDQISRPVRETEATWQYR